MIFLKQFIFLVPDNQPSCREVLAFYRKNQQTNIQPLGLCQRLFFQKIALSPYQKKYVFRLNQ